jgi:hypothetical protein
LFLACKKKEDKPEDPAPATTTGTTTTTGSTPTPTVFTDGFKLEDNLGNVYIADSAMIKPKEINSAQFHAYSGKFFGQAEEVVTLTFLKRPMAMTAKFYPVDSLDLDECYIFTGSGTSTEQYKITGGSVNITAMNTKATGTFTFAVSPLNGASGNRTSLKGTFNNIPVR